uniref:TLDc domain-containing protein n=1 Tax=Fagus sylvatica TaxID=28930 RepID=A0A2N9INF0_FAGSY
MGNAQSPPANPRYALASRAFSQKELEDHKSLFVSLAAQSQSDGKYIFPSVFKRYFGLHGPLGDRMFDLLSQQRKDQRLSFQDLVIAKGTYEKGTKDEIEEFIYQLVDVSGDGILGRSDLESVLIAMFETIFSTKDAELGPSSHKDVVDIFLNAATFSKHVDGCAEKSMSIEDFRNWCTLLPSVKKFLGSLLIPPDAGRPGSQVPCLVHLESVDSNMVLLRKEYAWHIGGALSLQELEEWKLLYHSAYNGLSFNTFLGSISKDDGPTVLIIKDKEGYVYGGYASQTWERHGGFYGDMKSFLFQLYPKASIFRPTGANNNIQWCAVNFSSEDIPNGIGFGGRVNHLGLFLSASFDQGHTFNCTTFGSPSLSKTSRICPEVIECWRVVPKGKQGTHDAVKGTVLDRFKEDRHMLNMVGLANSSE